MLNKFAKELKETREKAGMTLQNLSARSRLDIKFLHLMEKGDFSFLPELYVKAFIKDYAKFIGLDINETINKYEAAKKGIDYTNNKEEVKPENIAEKVKEKSEEKLFGEQQKNQFSNLNNINTGTFFSDKQKVKLLAVIGGVILIVIIALLVFNSNNEPEIIVKEKPYEEVRKETQQRFIEDKVKNSTTVNKERVNLSLVISSSDTSWIKVQTDTSKPKEYMLYPGTKINFNSQKRFLMIIGNSEGISFNLNNKNLDFSGKYKLVKYLLITKDGINYLKTEPTFTNN